MHFASDNSGPAHPNVMAALARANEGWARPYGNDPMTEAAVARIREVFEAPDAAVYFTATGTAANALILGTLVQPFDAVYCTAEAHIEEDECNAPEFFTGGAKLTLLDSTHAKMHPNALARALSAHTGTNVHGAQPGAVSLTQVTERGTLYTLAEITRLTEIAKRHALPVHLDGARFANALVALGLTPAEMSWKAGIDAVSFGGTKNGCLGVEAVIFFDPKHAWQFELRRKRSGHLFSKNRYLAAQMLGYLENDTWLETARSANAAGQALSRAIAQIEGVRIDYPTEANMVFASFRADQHQRLQDAGVQYIAHGDTKNVTAETMISARLVADWSSPPEDREAVARLLKV